MMENAQLVTKLKARVQVVEEIGGSIEADAKLIEYEIASYLKDIGVETSNAQAAHTTEAHSRAWERYIEAILLIAADRNRAG